MKFILLGIMPLFLSATSLTAQTNEYPRFLADSNGTGKYVVFTVEQAQKIDNDEALLKLFRIAHRSSGKVIKSLDSVIGCYNSVNGQLETKTKELEYVKVTQAKVIDDKFDEMAMSLRNIAKADAQLELKDSVIVEDGKIINKQQIKLKEQAKAINKQKTLKILGFGVGVVGIIVAFSAIL
jgi:hypothetical protein